MGIEMTDTGIVKQKQVPDDREVEALFMWLRSNPGVGDFDETQAAACYKELYAKHLADVARGKPGWMHMPADQLRDELVMAERARHLAEHHPSMSGDLSRVLAPAKIVVEPLKKERQIVMVDPAPTDEFIETLTSRVWNLSDGMPADVSGCTSAATMPR